MPNEKIGKIHLETTADYKRPIETKFNFYSTDTQPKIKFMITRNGAPVGLGQHNVDAYVKLIANDGSWVVVDLEVIDALNGVCQLTVPNDFLQHDGYAKGQLYISTDNRDETVTYVEFRFLITQGLIDTIPAVEKLFYIKKYDDLEKVLKAKANNITEFYKQFEQNIQHIEEETQKAINNIEQLHQRKEKELQDSYNTIIQNLQNNKSEYLDEIRVNKEALDTMLVEVRQQLSNSDIITSVQTTNWQKTKIFNDDSTLIKLNSVDFENMNDINSGFYLVENYSNAPLGVSGKVLFYYFKGANNVEIVQLYAIESQENYSRIKNSSGMWNEWKDFYGNFETVASAKRKLEDLKEKMSNQVSQSVKTSNSYTDEKLDEFTKQKFVLFSGSASTKGTVLKLAFPLSQFKYILIKYRDQGGAKVVPAYYSADNKIPITNFNLSDSSDGDPKLFEASLRIVNDNQLQVLHNNSYAIKSATAETDTNAIEIKEILGVM
ncbi:BppU family phage baseplate upper protein [Staphylococcus sp. IVB6227]|uniref:BppU family phage baseplate upper protein n=1 Tax=Staphylococcus sp. IVB6227 TaxID=2989768 RepID=UPI0021D30647|nr:BppU family phage baseplate upper protein [Staphylococcus sp. IVB6227]UXR79061.1 BppU family phage baseplate upper protein [Staphylococcus sp. IVB6227]